MFKSFKKLSALLLGGALLAVGCATEGDIHKLNERIDALETGRVATLESQITILKETTLPALESALKNEITTVKGDLEKKITALEQADRDLNTALTNNVNDLTAKISQCAKTTDLNQAKSDLTNAINQAKSQAETAIKAATDRIKTLEDANLDSRLSTLEGRFGTKYDNLDAAVNAAIAAAQAADAVIKKDSFQALINAAKKACEVYAANASSFAGAADNSETKKLADKVAAKFAELEQAYKDAEAVINGDSEEQKAAAKLNLENKISEVGAATAMAISEAIAGIEGLIIQAKAEFATAIGQLDGRLQKVETAVNETLPKAISDAEQHIQDLQALCERTYLTQADFNLYKDATAGTIRTMQASIDALTALTAGFPENQTIKEYIDAVEAKLDDYVLKTTFEAFVEKAATKAELEAAKGEINDRIDGVERAYKAADEALKEYVNSDEYLKDPEGAFQKVMSAAIKKAIDELAASVKEVTDALAQKISDLQTKDQELDAAIAALNKAIYDEETGILAKISAAEGRISAAEGRLDVVEDLLAGDWDGKTVQGYIDAADAQTLADAKDYTDQVGQYLLDEIGAVYDYINDMVIGFLIDEEIDARLTVVETNVAAIAKRLQAMTYVPDYDDMKMTMNVAYIVKDDQAIVLPQKTKVTYKFTPADVAYNIVDMYETLSNLTEEEFEEYQEEIGIVSPAEMLNRYFFFDVAGELKTRSSDNYDDGKGIEILGIDLEESDPSWGYITFEVMPIGLVSWGFTANELTPIDVLPWNYDQYYYYATWDYDELYVNFQNAQTGDDILQDSQNGIYYAFPIYNMDQLLDYRQRESYAVSLEFNQYDLYYDADGEFMYGFPYYGQPVRDLYIDWEEGTIYEQDLGYNEYWGNPEYSVDPYADAMWSASNSICSAFNVLMPSAFNESSIVEILEPPFINDPSDPDADDRGWVNIQGDQQELEYNKPNTDEDGVKVILDEAQPLVAYNGKKYTYEEMWTLFGILIEAPELTGTEYAYDKGTATADLNEDNFKEGTKDAETEGSLVDEYLTLSMSDTPEPTTLAQKKTAVGNIITGTYSWTPLVGDDFDWNGSVLIVKSKYETTATAHIDWTYALDAAQDHENFYNRRDEQGNIPIDGYNRTTVDVTIPENVVSDLNDKYGIESLADLFAEWHLEGYTVKEGNEVTYTNGGEGEKAVFSNLAVDADGNITVSVANFEFLPLDAEKKYIVTAIFENDNVRFTIEFTLTTKDRDRTPITITLAEYDFILNGNDYDEATDTYTSEDQDFSDPLYKKFVDQKIINQGDPKDFDDAEDFVEGEGQLTVNAEKDNSEFLTIGDDYATAEMTSPELKANMGSNQEITVNTYIGQEVKIILPVGVELPGYDFLHGTYYTFNTEHAKDGFIQKLDFEDNPTVDGEKLVKWWTRVNPSYLTGANNAQGEPESYRHALTKYDVSYINIAELAFNVVDKNDNILSDDDIVDNKIVVEFAYTDETLGAKALPQYSQTTIDPVLSIYSDLWMDQTTFYYRTNEKKFIPVIGKLAVMSGQTPFELPTRFDTPKAAVKVAGEVLDYSTYALVRWTPFIVPEKTENFNIILDENKIYREPLFKTINLKDQRPNGVSYDVIKDGEWVIGNVEEWDVEAGTYTEGGNGYVKNVAANVAYDITAAFVYDDLELPAELRKLLSIMYYGPDPDFQPGPGPRPAPGQNPPTPPTPPQQEPDMIFITEAQFNALSADEQKNYVPYVVYDYTSEITFHGKVTIHVNVVLNTPWQEPINFVYDVNIQGYDYVEPVVEP